MKRLVLAAFLTLGFAVQNIAAQELNIGAHFAPSLPLGDFADGGAEFGLGGGLSVDYYPNDKFNVGIEGEFIAFGIDGIDGESLTLIPLQLTGAYHTDLTDELDFYVGTGVGLFIQSATFEDAESESDLGITPRVGLAYELGDLLFLDFNVRYGWVFNGESEEFFGVTVESPDWTYLSFNLGLLYTIEL